MLNELMAVDVVCRESVLSSHQAERGSQVGFAYTRRAEKDHIFSALQKAHGSEFNNLALVDGGLKGKVKVVQGFLDGEAGHLYLLFIGAFAFEFGLFGKYIIKNLHNVEFVSNSPFQVVVQDFQRVFHLEALQVFPESVHRQLTHTAPRHTGLNLWISVGSQ